MIPLGYGTGQRATYRAEDSSCNEAGTTAAIVGANCVDTIEQSLDDPSTNIALGGAVPGGNANCRYQARLREDTSRVKLCAVP
ncbi:MAG: hypothetical protein ACI8X5_004309 [Planctomycetota bacterium]